MRRLAARCDHPTILDALVIDHGAGEALLSAFIEVSDVNALEISLQAAGVQIWQPSRDEPWAMRSLIVADPDGNLICFALTFVKPGAL
jgi:catechol 2,3-dioxygenase-like lactoylglutathione lyase family enzyme